MHNKRMRGQVWATDALTAATLLVFMILLSLLIWASAASANREAEFYNDMSLAALSASDALILTPGFPSYWNALPDLNDTSLAVPGLAQRRNVLSLEKWAALQALNATKYSLMGEKLGLGPYNYSITLYSLHSTLLGKAGMDAPQGSQRVHVERLAVMDGEVVRIAFEVWAWS